MVHFKIFFPFLCQIPVFKGAAKPVLGNSIDAGHFHGLDGLGDAPDPNAPGLDLVQKEGAVSAMIRIVNENPGEVRDVTQLYVCASFGSLKGQLTSNLKKIYFSSHLKSFVTIQIVSV